MRMNHAHILLFCFTVATGCGQQKPPIAAPVKDTPAVPVVDVPKPAPPAAPPVVVDVPKPAPPVTPPAGAKLVPLDLTPGGQCLTINAPPGTTATPNDTGGVLASNEKGFRLVIEPFDAFDKVLLNARRDRIRAKGADAIEDTENHVVGGTRSSGEENYVCSLKITVDGKPFHCFSATKPANEVFTRSQVMLMVESANTLTKTKANQEAESRMTKARAALLKLNCEYNDTGYTLEIGGDRVTDADLALAKDIPQICLVKIGEAGKLTPAGLKHLEGLPNLWWLILKGKRVNDSWLATAKPLRVRRLWIYETSISSSGWQHLKSLPELDELRINDQNVDDASVAQLAELKKLTELRLRSTKINAAELAKLKTALPKCEIEVTEE
jgi:hypothetical protein